MGVFDEKRLFERVGDGVRTSLLSSSFKDELAAVEAAIEESKLKPKEERAEDAILNLRLTMFLLRSTVDKHNESIAVKNDITRL